MSTESAQELRVLSSDVETTGRLASALAKHLRPSAALCLTGDLGAGKTTFVAALVRALGSELRATSPTFTLENRYPLAHAAGELLHVDLYRPDGMDDDELLASLEEARAEGDIVAVEWGSQWLEALRPCLEIEIEVDAHARRALTLRSHPAGWKHFDSLRETWEGLVA